MCRAGADYRRGDDHPTIAIVGACPGADEERECRPFIGDAGTHLAEMEVFVCGHPSSGARKRRYIGHPRAEKIRLWTHDSFRMYHPF